MSQCVHGERVRRTGNGPKGPWEGFFCPTPKGTPDQCSPEWVKTKKGASHAPPAPSQAPSVAPGEVVELLTRIAVALERISNKDLESVPF